MPFYFRKRPGSKNIKANITQRGLRSFTFTSGSKRGQPRLNFNTSRGWSFSFPGTGIMWRQKGYSNSRSKSVVEERGYDLRTKEGRLQHAENQANKVDSVICVAVGAGTAWLADSPYGLLAGYILFWLMLSIRNESLPTLVWALFVHLFALIGYGISILFDANAYELALWGTVFGNFVSAYITKNMGPNIFFCFLFFGCWAYWGDPSVYFAGLAERLANANYVGLPPVDLSFNISNLKSFFDSKLDPLFATGNQFNPLFFTLNTYATFALIFGLIRWQLIIGKKIKKWASSNLDLFIFSVIGILAFFFSCSLITIPSIFFMMLFFNELPRVAEITFGNYPSFAFILAGFSSTIGIIVNVSLRREKGHERKFWPIIFQCVLTLFWLPALLHKPEQNQTPKKSNSVILSKEPSPNKTPKKMRTSKGKNACPKENTSKVAMSDKFLLISREKLKYEELDKTLDSVIGLGKKRQAAISQAFPNLEEFLDKSDSEINSQTGLGEKLIARTKLALHNAKKLREMDILTEYLVYVFPYKSRQRNLILAAFSSFEQLYIFCKNPDDTLIGLNKNDLDHLVRITQQQKLATTSE